MKRKFPLKIELDITSLGLGFMFGLMFAGIIGGIVFS